MSELKPGWQRVKFGEVVRLNKETCKEPESAGIERVIGLEHLEPGDLRVRSWADVSDGTTFTNRVRPGQVLFGKRRSYQRKVAVADFDAVCSGDIYVLESADPDKLLPELLPFICQTDGFFDHAVGTSAGSLSPRTNWKSIAEYTFPLPPSQEQERLAALLSGTTRTITAIEDAIEAARLALRATSKHFLDRKFNPGQLVSFGEVVNVIDPNPSHRYPAYVEDGVPLVSTQDFDGADEYTYEKAKRVPLSTWAEQEGRCSFEANDVVFARKGVLGLARRYGADRKAFSHTVVIMKPRGDSIESEYLLWLVRSDRFMKAIRKSMNSNSGVPTLGVKAIESIEVPLPDSGFQSDFAKSLNRQQATISALQQRRLHASSVHNQILQHLCVKEVEL